MHIAEHSTVGAPAGGVLDRVLGPADFPEGLPDGGPECIVSGDGVEMPEAALGRRLIAEVAEAPGAVGLSARSVVGPGGVRE